MQRTPNPLPTRLLSVKTARRIHMVAGLFLLPWVLVYGISAFTFNHADWFSPNAAKTSKQARERPRSETVSLATAFGNKGVFSQLEKPESMAAKLLDTINTHQLVGSPEPWTLATEFRPKYSDKLYLFGNAGKDHVSIEVDLKKREASIQRRDAGAPVHTPPKEPRIAHTLRLDEPVLTTGWRDSIRAELASAIGVETAEIGQIPALAHPSIQVAVSNRGELFDAVWNLETNEVVMTSIGPAAGAARRNLSFMQSLHKTRGYPDDRFSPKWWWAILVDCMAILMVFWATSGLLMWWKLKNQRKLGIATLGLCAVVAWWVWTTF